MELRGENCIDNGGMGTSCQINPGIIEKYCYGNNPNNCTLYGGLYEWSEIMGFAPECNGSYDFTGGSNTCGTGQTYTISPHHQGICPEGWHLPSETEWNTLAAYTSGDPGCDVEIGCDPAGKKLKSAPSDTPAWDGTNDFGFNASMTGWRVYQTSFMDLNNVGLLWTTNGDLGYLAYIRKLRSDVPGDVEFPGIYPYYAARACGLAVRCIEN